MATQEPMTAKQIHRDLVNHKFWPRRNKGEELQYEVCRYDGATDIIVVASCATETIADRHIADLEIAAISAYGDQRAAKAGRSSGS